MPTEGTPVVSVVIPTHDSAQFVVEAIEAVLRQTYGAYEIIVVDDGSRDETREIVKRFGSRITYHYQSNRGPAAARNAGIAIARGEYICFLDADDLWLPHKLAAQVAVLAARTDVGIVFADAEEWDGDTLQKSSIVGTSTGGAEILSRTIVENAFRKLVVENFIPTSSVMARKECLLRAGLFDEQLQNAEDRDMWLRVAADSAIACLPQVLVKKRSHGANISTRTEVTLRSRVKVWEKARSRYPALAPAALYNRLLAGTFQQLGFLLLGKGEGRAARSCGFASLRHAAAYLFTTRSTFPFRWPLSIALILLSALPWPLIDYAWQARNRLRERNHAPAVTVARDLSPEPTESRKA